MKYQKALGDPATKSGKNIKGFGDTIIDNIKKDIKVKSNTSKKDEKPKSDDIKDSKKAKNSKSDN